MNDLETIIRGAQQGDTLAFSLLVDRFRHFAHERALAWLGDHHRAEEVVQEAFLEAALKLHQLQSPLAFSAWFKRILVKQCDRVTRLKSLPSLALSEATDVCDGAPSAAESVAETRRNTLLHLALTTLTPEQRDLLHAVYWENEPQRDLSERLNLPLTTVKKRLYTARQRIAAFLEQTGDFAEDSEASEVFPREVQLFMAAWHGHLHRVAAILDNEPGLIDTFNDEGMSLLLFAAHASHYSGNRRVTDHLLNRGMTPGLFESAALGLPCRSTRLATVNATGPWCRTALHWAACGGHDSRVRELLLQGADPNLPDQWGCTPVHLAADFGHANILTALLAASGDPRRVMNNGKNIMHLAARHGDPELLRIASRAGLPLDLFAAASLGDLALADRLLRQDRDGVNARLRIGASPLHIAAEHGHTEMAAYLLSRGAHLDAISAIALDREDALLQLLADQPTTIDRRAGSFGFTPLHAASVRGRDGLVRLLLHQGAEVNRTDRMFRKTPMHEALFFGRESSARLLRVHGGQLHPHERN